MIIAISFIPGFMVGIEFDYIDDFIAIDLGIIRIVFYKITKEKSPD